MRLWVRPDLIRFVDKPMKMKALISGLDLMNRITTIFALRVFIILILASPFSSLAQSVSNTYSDGDIPTSLPPFNPTCNGPVTTLEVELPTGGPWVVTGIDIVYEMLAQNGGWKSHQRSQVYCQTTDKNESSIYSGTGDEEGVQDYSRTNVAIANGTYAGGTSFIFEMKAMRTTEGSGCNTTYNRVNNFTWEITVYYTTYTESGSVGIGNSSPDPSAILDLSASTKGLLPPRMNTGLRLAIEEPADGLVVYDTDFNKLYCYSGSEWQQLNPDFISVIRDADNDTKIQVEKSADDDKIRFDLGGNERWIMEGPRLVPFESSIYIGEDAGLDADGSSSSNIGIGNNSLLHNVTGYGNIAIGEQSLSSSGTGDNNIAIGVHAQIFNDGDHNVGIGFYSLGSNWGIDGSDNTAVGYYSGAYNSSGIDLNQCTFVGASSGTYLDRTNITMLGYGITTAECTGDNQVLLGNTAITSIRAEVTGLTAYSDARYKTNITEDIKGLDFIKRLRPVSYNVRPTELHKIWGTPDSLYQHIDHSDVEQIRFSGFLAQEVEQAAEASNYSFTGIDIPKNENETYALRYTEFIVPLVKALQEQQHMIEQLQNQITNLSESNNEWGNKFDLLEEKMKALHIKN